MFIFGSALASICSSRASVVPYTIIRNPNYRPQTAEPEWQIKFLVGIDKDSGDLTDLGGGVKHKLDFNNLNASLREITEETKQILGDTITVDTLLTCVAATQSPQRRFPIVNTDTDNISTKIQYDIGGLSVIFAPIENKWIEDAPRLFDTVGEHPGGEDFNEMSKLVWVTETEFLEMASGSTSPFTMWSKLQKFYSAIYTKELHDLLYIRYWWFDPYFNATARASIEAADRFIDSFIVKPLEKEIDQSLPCDFGKPCKQSNDFVLAQNLDSPESKYDFKESSVSKLATKLTTNKHIISYPENKMIITTTIQCSAN